MNLMLTDNDLRAKLVWNAYWWVSKRYDLNLQLQKSINLVNQKANEEKN